MSRALLLLVLSCGGNISPSEKRASEAREFTRIMKELGHPQTGFAVRGRDNTILVVDRPDCTFGEVTWLLSIKSLRDRLGDDGFGQLVCDSGVGQASPPWDETYREMREKAINDIEGEDAKNLLRATLKP